MNDTPRRKFLSLQALRIVAAVFVVFTHSTFYAYERLDRSFAVWERGTRGVDIFFVISGFVMIYASGKLLGKVDGWKEFAQHRIVRIVPLYWLVTTLKVAILLGTAGLALHSNLNAVTAFCSYAFLPARDLDGKIEPLVGVGWTLTFEMFFYLVFAFALFLRKNVFLVVGIVLAGLSIGAIFRQPSWPTAAFYLNPLVLEFFFGMLIAKACTRGKYCPPKLAPWVLIAGFVFLLLPPFETTAPKFLISGVPASMIVWAAASLFQYDSLIPRWILYLGDASYSIYLIHPFVCPLPPAVLHRLHSGNPWLSVAVSVLLGTGAGCLLHQFVELPMTQYFRSKIKPRGERQLAAA
jgi:peptidoglycan/LPS O-acetylase OafA/YrhL